MSPLPRDPSSSRPTPLGMSMAERRRLLLLAVAFVAMLALFFGIGSLGGERPVEEETGTATQEQSVTGLPPVDPAVLAEVRDGSATERAILETEPFAYLARMAAALLPEHLWRLGQPALPFDGIEEHAAELRGKPFRLRGEILFASPVRRAPDAPEEYWARMRAEDGHEFLYVALQVPETLFGSENFALADGYFFKIYTTTLGEERVTLPLLVGRRLLPSYREAAPVREPDPALLADVQDATLLRKVELDFRGLWHLMNVARTLRDDKEALDAIFRDAPELNRETILRLKDEGALYRGRPFRLPGRVLSSANGFWFERAGENPLREEFLTNAFLGSLSLGRQPVRLLAPGKVQLLARSSKVRRWYRGWFLQWWAYEDSQLNTRITPVFVVADMVEEPLPASPLLRGLTWIFLGGALVFAGLVVVLMRRERRRARESAEALKRLRERRRAGRGT